MSFMRLLDEKKLNFIQQDRLESEDIKTCCELFHFELQL